MQKNIIKKQAEEKLQQLKDLLMRTDISAPATHEEVLEIRHRLQEAERIITVYEYLLAQQAIAHDFNVHFKVMEESEKLAKQEEEKKLIKETVKENTAPSPPEAQEIKNPQPDQKTEIIPDKTKVTTENRPAKKLEISINDKFRMINELFHHNQQEYNIAIEQLNAVQTWEEAQVYILGLVGVYNWDEEKDIVKTLKRISQKRFL